MWLYYYLSLVVYMGKIPENTDELTDFVLDDVRMMY